MNLDRGLSRFVVLGGAISLPRLSFFFKEEIGHILSY